MADLLSVCVCVLRVVADFSQRLAEAFPHVSQKQLPRLSKKMTLFVTRSTLNQRRDDLDIWVRRLADIHEIRDSKLLSDFLYDSLAGCMEVSSPSPSEASSSSKSSPFSSSSASPSISSSRRQPPPAPLFTNSQSGRPSLNFSRPGTASNSPSRADFFATKELPPTPSALAYNRPALAHKRSTPNLRYAPNVLDQDIPPTPPPPFDIKRLQAGTPPLPVQATASSATSLKSRPSLDSVARSVSTDHTITPATLQKSTSSATRQSSGRQSPRTPRPSNAEEQPSLEPPPPRKAILRHFMSLQDIVCAPFSHFFRASLVLHGLHIGVQRQNVQPQPPFSAGPAKDRPAMAPRSRSSSSTSQKSQLQSSSSRPLSYSSRRSSGGSSGSKHRHNSSATSLQSIRSHHPSGSSASNSSLSEAMGLGSLSSHDGSLTYDSSGPGSPTSLNLPQTPPTPQWTEPPSAKSVDGQMPSTLFNPNIVPLPPTFSFPGGSRSRSGSRAPLPPGYEGSGKKSLDLSCPSQWQHSSMDASWNAPDSTIILKARHQDSIVMVKVNRKQSLADVRHAVADRFKSHEVLLHPDFQLARMNRTPSASVSGVEPATPLQTDSDWHAASATTGKLTLLC